MITWYFFFIRIQYSHYNLNDFQKLGRKWSNAYKKLNTDFTEIQLGNIFFISVQLATKVFSYLIKIDICLLNTLHNVSLHVGVINQGMRSNVTSDTSHIGDKFRDSRSTLCKRVSV